MSKGTANPQEWIKVYVSRVRVRRVIGNVCVAVREGLHVPLDPINKKKYKKQAETNQTDSRTPTKGEKGTRVIEEEGLKQGREALWARWMGVAGSGERGRVA